MKVVPTRFYARGQDEAGERHEDREHDRHDQEHRRDGRPVDLVQSAPKQRSGIAAAHDEAEDGDAPGAPIADDGAR